MNEEEIEKLLMKLVSENVVDVYQKVMSQSIELGMDQSKKFLVSAGMKFGIRIALDHMGESE